MALRRLKLNITDYGFILTFGTVLLLGLHSVVACVKRTPLLNPDLPCGVTELPPAFSSFLINVENAKYFAFFKLLFPVLALLPAAFLHAQAARSGSDLYLILRKSKVAYFWSTLGIAVVSTFAAIASPLIIASGIAHLILPEFGLFNGGPPWGVFDQYLAEGSFKMLFPGVLINSPFASTVLVALATGGLAALYGGLMLVVSFYLPRDYVAIHIALILPVFLFSQSLDTIGRAAGFRRYNPLDQIAIQTYLRGEKYYFALLVFIVVCLVLIAAGTVFRSRRDVF